MATQLHVAGSDHSAPAALRIQRIPAWKRLGLKLKFANEQTDMPIQLDDSTSTSNKLHCDDDPQSLLVEAKPEHARKKRPRLDSLNAQSVQLNGTDIKSGSHSLKREGNSLKKSVSFTSDTKVEDGDSSRSLIADWEAQYDQPSFSSSSPNHSKPLERRNPHLPKPPSSLDTRKPHAALEYLTRFSQTRGAWKFSKNKEVWILKHIFSIDIIPSDYDIALIQYLTGLKSSAARSRLRQEATEAVHRDQEQQVEEPVLASNEDGTARLDAVPTNMEDPERRRAYYEDSIRRYKRRLEEHLDQVAEEDPHWMSPERLAKRRRAEIVLWATGVTPPSVETTESSNSIISGHGSSRSVGHSLSDGFSTDHPQKKRKNRTSVVELLSSSEDESDDSSTGSDSEEEESDEDSSSSSGGGKAAAMHTQMSASTRLRQEPGSDDDTESSSDSSEGSVDYRTDPDKAAINSGRPTSIISISS